MSAAGPPRPPHGRPKAGGQFPCSTRPLGGKWREAPPRGEHATAVVFAYHNVGARCLRVLLAHGVTVPLVVTHEDSASEGLWFERVADVASSYVVPVIAPADPNDVATIDRVRALAPDFLFSFYYRQMLGAALLDIPARGALNMHGSLLPKYRGRVPVNWAVLHGEKHTGASLHYMVAKPDAGDLVDQTAVPILPDDTARDVLDKVTVAAEITLDRALPGLIAGTAPRRPLDLALGCYFGGRMPEDGRIDWSQPAPRIHDLVRAVAPPYPGALTTVAGQPARVLRTRVRERDGPRQAPVLHVTNGRFLAQCGGGGTLELLELEVDGVAVAPAQLGSGPWSLGERP